jgi:hypothetical protein
MNAVENAVPGEPETSPVPRVQARDGMTDSAGYLDASSPLAEALALVHQELLPTFEAARERARVRRAVHRKAIFLAASAGAAAIVLAASELAAGQLSAPLAAGPVLAIRILEAVLAAAAIGGALWGGLWPGRQSWFLDRVREESCRLLKYEFLLDPSLWSHRGDESEQRCERFQRDAAEVRGLNHRSAAAWLSRGPAPRSPVVPVGSGIPQHTVHSLVDYYKEQRLEPALEDAARKLSQRRSGALSRGLTPAAFLAGVALVAVHVAAEWRLLRVWSLAALVLATALPVLAAAAHVFRIARGPARSRMRLQALRDSLSKLSERLEKAVGAENVFRELGFCEHMIETDARESLRRAAEGDAS